jgi:hypothetical protein
MKDAVVILHAEAIPVAQEFCLALQDYEVLLFDPVLGDKALAAKLLNVQVITQIEVPPFVSIDREAQAAARALEEALDATQFGSSGVSILAWQHLNLSYIFTVLRWYDALWQSVGGTLKNRRIHIPVSHHPGQYYFDSFVPASILIEYLKSQRVEYVLHEYGIGSVWVDTAPDLTGIAPGGGPEWLLTYLPTCVYDHDYFVQEMRAAGKRIVNLQAKLWDVPVAADRTIGLTPTTRLLACLPIGRASGSPQPARRCTRNSTSCCCRISDRPTTAPGRPNTWLVSTVGSSPPTSGWNVIFRQMCRRN